MRKRERKHESESERKRERRRENTRARLGELFIKLGPSLPAECILISSKHLWDSSWLTGRAVAVSTPRRERWQKGRSRVTGPLESHWSYGRCIDCLFYGRVAGFALSVINPGVSEFVGFVPLGALSKINQLVIAFPNDVHSFASLTYLFPFICVIRLSVYHGIQYICSLDNQ